jgi:hypothetical protein
VIHPSLSADRYFTVDKWPMTAGIAFKKKSLSVKVEDYLKRLKAFERKHKMKSETFLKKFNSEKTW